MSDIYPVIPVIVVVVLVVLFLSSAIRILNEYQRAVIFCLGRIIDTKGPGIIILMPIVEYKIHFLTLPKFQAFGWAT